MRLDLYLVDKNMVRSRARAKDAIKAGLVQVNGALAGKPSIVITPQDDVQCVGETHEYVSRGALKLLAALDAFAVTIGDKICLDLGASTGGFTHVLLQAGAQRIYAVDVGTDQLVDEIRNDAKVICLEKTHSRGLSRALIPDPIDLLVCDVSFISIMKALPPAMKLCADDATMVVLVKPQFELGREALGKGGIVSQSQEQQRAWIEETITPWLTVQGWSQKGLINSPIRGSDGNSEFLLWAEKTLDGQSVR